MCTAFMLGAHRGQKRVLGVRDAENQGPLQEKLVFLATEPSQWPPNLFASKYTLTAPGLLPHQCSTLN